MTADHARSHQGRHVIDLFAVALAVGVVAALLAVYFQRGFVPGDAFTYLGAGERLNAGHALYALVAGDRQVGVEPPYWTVPLLSPPPIAVLWRPLAALPSELGVYLWSALDVGAVVLAIGLMLRRRPLAVALAVLACSIPLVYEIGVGNMNGLILLGLVLAWRAVALGNQRVAGILVGLMAAFKLTPIVMAWWLVTTGRWMAVRWVITAGLVVLAISVAGAGLDAHFRYLGIIRDTAAQGARPLSLTGMALFIGVPSAIAGLLPNVVLLAGATGMALLRRHPGATFITAVITMVLGSPTVSINWFIYLLACLAPLVWPAASRSTEPAPSPIVVPIQSVDRVRP